MKYSILLSIFCHILLATTIFFSLSESDNSYKVSGTTISIEIVSSEMAASAKDNKTDKERNNNRSKEVSYDEVSDSSIKKYDELIHSQDESSESSFESDYSMAIIRGSINGVPLPVPIYPALAKKRNITGTNTVDITIEPSGRISKIDIVKSSGSRLLDNATKETIEKRWKLPPPKKEIIVRKNFEFEIIN